MFLFRSITAGILLTALVSQAAAGVVVSKSQITSVLGTEGPGKIVYIRKSDGYPYFIDFSASTLSEKKVCSKAAHGPLISPDGTSLLFWSGAGISSASNCTDNTGTMYACDLAAGASPVNLGDGFNPHWWIDPASGYTYVVYHTRGCKSNWPQPGETRKQRINPDTYAKIGSSTLLLDKSFAGGLSKNGRYLCTAYDKVYMYDLQGSSLYTLNDGNQGCNPSITPSDDPAKQDRMMQLFLAVRFDGIDYAGHETFGVRDRNDDIKWYVEMPPMTAEWQNPEWSTHENFCTATANRSGDYNVYLVKMDDKAVVRVADGDNEEPHLWVKGSSTVTPPDTLELPLKMNVGDNSVSGWESDAAYATGDNFYTSPYTIATAGVSDAGPAEMYKTCRHNGPEFDFDLPDGDYTVRLHFCEPHHTDMTTAATRNMDVKIEGQTVLSSFNPGVAAGAVQKAYVYETTATVSDGNGLDIDLVDNGGDAFIMGIEVVEGASGVYDHGSAAAGSGFSCRMLAGGRTAFVLPEGVTGPVAIRSLGGAVVRKLSVRPGLVWDGRDAAGAAVRPGVYAASVNADGRTVVLRMTVVR